MIVKDGAMRHLLPTPQSPTSTHFTCLAAMAENGFRSDARVAHVNGLSLNSNSFDTQRFFSSTQAQAWGARSMQSCGEAAEDCSRGGGGSLGLLCGRHGLKNRNYVYIEY